MARRRRARLLGYAPRWPGFRTSDLTHTLPTQLKLGDQIVDVLLPDEAGVRAAFLEVLLEDVYELDRMHGSVHTIIDIGANAGLFVFAAARRFPGSRIHAYEPNPMLAPYLRHQAEVAGAEWFGEAVQEQSGFVNLDVREESVAGRTITSSHGPIPAVAFSETVRRIGGSVDLVKLDCEGAEWEIIEDHATWQAVDRIAMEYHSRSDKDSHVALDSVSALGFQISRHRTLPWGAGIVLAAR